MAGHTGKHKTARVQCPPGRGTRGDLSRLLGVTRQAVHEQVNRGVIAVGEDGLLDLDAAVASWRANVTPEPEHLKASRKGRPSFDGDPDSDGVQLAPDGGESRAMAETRKARAAADLAEYTLRIKRGEYVEAATVERDAFTAARVQRNRVLAVPADIAPLVRAAPSDAEARLLMERALRDALRAAAEEIAATAAEDTKDA